MSFNAMGHSRFIQRLDHASHPGAGYLTVSGSPLARAHGGGSRAHRWAHGGGRPGLTAGPMGVRPGLTAGGRPTRQTSPDLSFFQCGGEIATAMATMAILQARIRLSHCHSREIALITEGVAATCSAPDRASSYQNSPWMWLGCCAGAGHMSLSPLSRQSPCWRQARICARLSGFGGLLAIVDASRGLQNLLLAAGVSLCSASPAGVAANAMADASVAGILPCST